MKRLTLYIPERLNDGAPASSDQLAEYESELLGIAGGFTLTHGVGSWRSDSGLTYREPVRLYALDVPDFQAAREKLVSLANRIALDLAQEAVYVTVSPVDGRAVTVRPPRRLPALASLSQTAGKELNVF